jgi:hypothetical protein
MLSRANVLDMEFVWIPPKKCLGEIAVGTFNGECLLKRAPSARLAW